MAYYFPEGTKVFYSNTLASAKNITVLSNATPAVATSVAHGYIDLDPILLTSGWEEANSSVYEVDQLTADTFGVTGLDSSNTNLFAAGTGIGSAQKISNWVEMQQVLDVSTSGGGPKYGTIAPLASRQEKKQVIGYEASSIDVKVGYDPQLAQQIAMQALARVYSKVAFKLVTPGGGRIYGYGTLTAANFPEMSRGNALQISVGIGFDGQVIGY